MKLFDKCKSCCKALLPWNWSLFKSREEKEQEAAQRLIRRQAEIHNEVSRMFDDFFRGFGFGYGLRSFDRPFSDMTRLMSRMDGVFGQSGFGLLGTWPTVDVREGEKDIEVVAELPGMDEGDVQVTLSDHTLHIRGEKKSSHSETKKGVCVQECSYGSFRRDIPLPTGVDEEHADARFKNGVLTVRLPKRHLEGPEYRKIPVRTVS